MASIHSRINRTFSFKKLAALEGSDILYFLYVKHHTEIDSPDLSLGNVLELPHDPLLSSRIILGSRQAHQLRGSTAGTTEKV